MVLIDGVIIDGCGDLCGELAKRTDKLVGEICDILCVVVGIDEFIKILEK